MGLDLLGVRFQKRNSCLSEKGISTPLSPLRYPPSPPYNPFGSSPSLASFIHSRHSLAQIDFRSLLSRHRRNWIGHCACFLPPDVVQTLYELTPFLQAAMRRYYSRNGSEFISQVPSKMLYSAETSRAPSSTHGLSTPWPGSGCISVLVSSPHPE